MREVVGKPAVALAARSGWQAALVELTDQTFEGDTLRAILTAATDDLRLRRCDLRGAHLRSADFTDVTFEECVLDNVDLRGASLGGASFIGCRLMGADFEDSRGFGFSITRCNAFAANLTGAVLARADLSGTRFTEAVLRGADLRSCLFDGCDLSAADLTMARLDGADLRGAGLGACDLDRLRALKGAIVTTEQAAEIVRDLTGATVL
ncbi:pentapeptide repeat-containing protein [Dermatophilaceae bacterium Sec6.4]